MDLKTLKSHLFNHLKKDARLWHASNTEIDQILLLHLVDKMDPILINILFDHPQLRAKFFLKIKDTHVFKANEFRFFIEENQLDNSYTAYKNRIGLTSGRKFLQTQYDVVLDWPYKDCVLAGGQTTEEGKDTYFEYQQEKKKTIAGKHVTIPAGYQKKNEKRKEVFFNQVLAHDEIDRLFDPKVFVQWKRITAKGEQPVQDLRRDRDGILRENMLIKGNNLLVLHSLKKQFAGKVKLIYIDPPYNTGNDGFKYNDRFNHSTWLTFMKNRLEIARELLREDGVIFVQCDDNEQAYLKVLMDGVFGRGNFVANFIAIMNPRGRQEASYPIAQSHEYLLAFSKNPKKALFHLIKQHSKFNKSQRLLSLKKSGNASSRVDRPNMFYPIFYRVEDSTISTTYLEDLYLFIR